MELRIPKLREGSYFPSLLEPRRRTQMLAVIQQAYVEGVSTREGAGIEGISKSQVSRISSSETASLTDRWTEERTATYGWTR